MRRDCSYAKWLTLLVAALAPAPAAWAQSEAPLASRHALIVVGLPGDAAHVRIFADTTRQWRRWLTETLQFPAENVTILFGKTADSQAEHRPATKENLQAALAALKKEATADDALWVFYLGHASYDGERAWLHLYGPDMNDRELAALLSEIPCREQVIWLTQTASGWFLKSLAGEGRVVISATEADQEFNETRFPHLLAAVTQRDPQLLDTTGDGRVSLAELFVAVSRAVAEQFEKQNLAPTEHALLDDDGDGRGTEAAGVAEVLASPTGEPPPDLPRSLRPDGAAAGKLLLPWK